MILASARHVDLTYEVLGSVNLGADAANLWRGEAEPPWSRVLAEALRQAPGRIQAQVACLRYPDLEKWLEALRSGECQGLQGVDNASLREALIEGLLDRERLHVWEEGRERALSFVDAYGETIRGWREVLWGERTAPELYVLDTPALGRSGWTHGRATSLGPWRVVAVSCEAGVGAALQILHEETHPVTDPEVRSAWDVRQETRRGSVGFGLHTALERAVVERDEALLRTCSPGWLEDFERWCDVFNARLS